MRSSAWPFARLAGDRFVYLPYYVILCLQSNDASAADVGQWSWCWSDETALADYAIMMIICLK